MSNPLAMSPKRVIIPITQPPACPDETQQPRNRGFFIGAQVVMTAQRGLAQTFKNRRRSYTLN